MKTFNFFDAAYVINLDRDTDKLARVMSRFSTQGIEPTRFSGIIPDDPPDSGPENLKSGHHGCGMSHQRIIETAFDDGCENVLVFEDDVILRDDTAQIMRSVVAQLQNLPWDILYLGLDLDSDSTRVSPNLFQFSLGYHLHAYAVNRPAMQTVARAIEDAVVNRDWHHDAAVSRAPGLTKYHTDPLLAIQEPGYSATYNKVIDRSEQYFSRFDGKDFIAHCKELREINPHG